MSVRMRYVAENMSSVMSTSRWIFTNVASIILLGMLSYLVLRPLYNLFLHPLRAYPGPLLWRASPIPRALALARGRLPFEVSKFQKKYGKVVRIGPDELAFVSVEAWKDIYGHRTGGQNENPKDAKFYRVGARLGTSIITADRSKHGELRRLMAHGFSERSMREQESIIGGYVDLLMQRLGQHCNNGATALNMREWYNWTTFDLIGNLAFGSDFQCLQSATYAPWIRMITDTFKLGAWLQALAYIGLEPLARTLLKPRLGSMESHTALTREKVFQRIEMGRKGERPDFLVGLIRNNIGVGELAANAGTLIVAGSETTATLLTGATYLLTTNPEALARLVSEVRSTFKSEEEISLLSVQKLPYMLACLNEALRCYPPVAGGLPRIAQAGGTTVADHHVPEGTSMAVWQWAINHNPEYWTDVNSFKPERWTGEDYQYANDTFEAMQPFAVGPRNCIGRNLAYAEMRLILARIIFSFELSLADDSKGWIDDQECFTLWHKPALNVYLTPRVR